MLKCISDPAFDMDAPVLKDESVRDYQYYSYDARVFDERGRIELQVQDTIRYFLPAEAFLEIEGKLVKTDKTPYAIGDQVGFVNNGIMALFKGAAYVIDGREIEVCHNDIDVATTIIGLARYSDDYSRSAGPSMMFAKDTTDHLESRNVMLNAAGNTFISMNENFSLGFASRR